MNDESLFDSVVYDSVIESLIVLVYTV
jgi:hypothetical protein